MSRRVVLPEGEASFTDEGTGPPAVCLHGLPGSARDFRWLASALCSFGFRCVRIEMPGFGDNRADVGTSTAALADHVHRMLMALQLEGSMMIGHSFGAVVALQVAVRHPKSVDRLVLLSSPGLRQHQGLRPAGWGMEVARLARVPMVGPVARAALQAGFRASGFRHEVNAQSVVRTLDILRSFDFGTHASAWSRLRAPTGMAWCSDDPFIEDAIAQDLARRAPEGPRLRFSSGGHNPQKHFALEIAEMVANWTNGAKSASSAPAGSSVLAHC